MNKLYLLSCFLLLTATHLSGQEAATPVVNRSKRIVLHFKDTTGLFAKLGRLLIDRGHSIDFKDREFGIISTKSTPIPMAYTYTQQMEIKTIFRDSTITLSSVIHWEEYHYEVTYTKKDNSSGFAWNELMQISEQLKPESISYLPFTRAAQIPKSGRF